MAFRKTQSQWLALFEEQKQSGLSIAKFCQQKQLSEAYFYLKRKKLQSQESELSTFVTARPESSLPDLPDAGMTLHFGQCQLKLDSSTNSQWLSELMKSLS